MQDEATATAPEVGTDPVADATENPNVPIPPPNPVPEAGTELVSSSGVVVGVSDGEKIEPAPAPGDTITDGAGNALRALSKSEVRGLLVQQVAAKAHMLNREYCAMIGDSSQPTWDEAEEWHKGSAIQGVLHIVANPGTTPRQSHESWLKQKAADGWVYGPEKNPEAKTHPCIVEYDQLPEEQRVKDVLFTCIVKVELAHMKEVHPDLFAEDAA